MSGCCRQAILVLRWLLDGTRITQLAVDNQVSRSTGYPYLHEGLTVIADQAPGLSSVLLATKTWVPQMLGGLVSGYA